MVLPAVNHFFAPVEYRSELGAFLTSIVRIEPSGRSVHPSAALKSAFPVPDRTVHVNVFGFSIARLLVSLFPTMNVPLGRTTDGESPMYCQPDGGSRLDHFFATGS